MNLRAKIYIPVTLSLLILGGSLYWLNKQVLRETFDIEMNKVLNSKEKNFNEHLDLKTNFLTQYANVLSNSYALRSAFRVYKKTNDLDTSWTIVSSEIDRIKYGGSLSKIKVPNVNCYVPPGVLLYNSSNSDRGENVTHVNKLVHKSFKDEKSVWGIESNKQGLFVKSITPVIIRNRFYGSIELSYSLSDLVIELNPEEYESYALIVDKDYANKMSQVEAAKSVDNFIQENLIINRTEGFDLQYFSELYDKDIDKKNIFLHEDYNYLQVPIVNYDNEIVATLIYQMDIEDFRNNMKASSSSLLIIGFIIMFFALGSLLIVLRIIIIMPIKKIRKALSNLSRGVIADEIEVKTNDEIAKIQTDLNVVNDGLRGMSKFAIHIGNGEYETDFKALSEQDELGNTLVQVRDKLKVIAEEQETQSILENQRKWSVEGQAKFAEILQNTEMKIDEYTYHILSNLIKYLDVNQGAFFLLSKDKESLLLSSAYAYDRRKFLDKDIKVGDGLLGNTAKEQKVTYLTDLPSDYISITSGLGDATPSSLLIVPLVSDGELYGIYELASFRDLEDYEIDFCTKIAENITQAISRQQINEQTKELLEQSRQQAEELAAQEEEMRQNLEEMQATQEEMARKEAEMTGVLNALNQSTLVVEFDLEGNVLTVNDEIIRLLGLTSKEDIIGKNHRNFYDSDDYEKDQSTLWGPLKQNRNVARKSQITLPNSDKLWLNETYSPILDEHGNVVRVLNISFDITEEVVKELQISQQNEEMQAQEEEMRQNLEEMQATQEEMARKEAEMSSLLNALDTSSLVIELDLDGNITNANDQYLELLKAKGKDSVIGKKHADFYENKTHEEENAELWTPLSQNETVSRIAEIKTLDDSKAWLNETYTPILDENDKVKRILNISFDVTDQILKEQQVAQQNEEMLVQEEMMQQNMEEMISVQEEMAKKEAEMESMQNAINYSTFVYEMNLDGDILKVNQSVLDLFGLESDEKLIGQNHKKLYAVKGYKAEKEKIWAQIMGKEAYSRKAEIKLPSGEVKLLNETYSPIIDENYEVDRIISISFEINQ
jgi:methyl-accepting chemotaxis protein